MSKKPKSDQFSSVEEMVKAVSDDAAFEEEFSNRVAAREVVKKLFAIRNSMGLSQKDIAERIGCTQSKVSKLEAGTDADLRVGDLESYLSCLGLEGRLILTKGEPRVVDDIKYYFCGLSEALNRLKDLAHNDPQIAAEVGNFSQEVAFNFIGRISQFISELPSDARKRCQR